jgi:hypothetical protein
MNPHLQKRSQAREQTGSYSSAATYRKKIPALFRGICEIFRRIKKICT